MSATVTSVTEIIGTGGEQTTTATEFTRAYLVKLSAASNIGQDLALTASAGGTSIPAIADAWPRVVSGRPTPTVKSKSAKLHDRSSRLLWLVEVKYDNEAITASESQSETAPWLRSKTYRSAPVNYDMALERDFAATPALVRNSAGDAFDPVPTYPHANRVLTVTRASLLFSESNAQALQNTVNNASFTVRGNSYAAGTLRLNNWTAETAEWTNDSGSTQSYYQETIEIEVATNTWGHMLRVLDQGYRYKDGAEILRAMDDSTPARPVPEPILLNGSGGKGSDASPIFLDFQQFPLANWASLGVL